MIAAAVATAKTIAMGLVVSVVLELISTGVPCVIEPGMTAL